MRCKIINALKLSIVLLGCSFAVHAHTPSLGDSQLLLPLIFSCLCLVIALVSIWRLRKSEALVQRSETKFKNSILASGDVIWEWHIENKTMERMNDGALKFFYSKHDIFPNQSNIHPKDQSHVKQQLQRHLNGDCAYFEATYRTRDINNRWRWVLDRGKVIESTSDLKPRRMTGTLKDISVVKSTQERLNLFANCIENISDAIAIFDKNFVMVEVNKSYLRYFGGNASDHLGKSINLPNMTENRLQQLLERLKRNGYWHKEVTFNDTTQTPLYFELAIDAVTNNEHQLTHYIAVYSDISERKNTELQLQKLTNRDKLTGLPNRNLFFTNMTNLVANKTHHALLVFDLDNFKKINDSLGHQAGDILLCRLANRLNKITRQQDEIYRLGGDEFALVMTDTNDIHTITNTAKRFLAQIAKPFMMSGHELVITSSVGIVLFPEDGNSPEVLLKNADTAMYHAKQHGNRYLFFNDTMNRQAVKRLQIENLIRYGLKEDYFNVFYQPKMDIATGKIMGMEALVRFITPNKGLISPAQFIPIAEETGQIIEVGEVVLDKACRDVKRWVELGLFDGRVAVNLSAKQFMLPDLTARIDDILQKHGLPSYFLELEITEGTVMHDPKDAIKIMNALNARGIHLAMDDFGTGYSSLAYLKQFPLNTLKVDKAFIDDMGNEKGKNMVDSIVTIAHNLGLTVVAEGVEYEQQVHQLTQLKCEMIQGYFYSKPLSQEQFEQFLRVHNKASESNTKQSEVKLTLVSNER